MVSSVILTLISFQNKYFITKIQKQKTSWVNLGGGRIEEYDLVIFRILKIKVLNKGRLRARCCNDNKAFFYSCGNRRRQTDLCEQCENLAMEMSGVFILNCSVCLQKTVSNPSRGASLHAGIWTPHHKIMTSLRIHIWYCWWVHSSLPVFWGCFPIRNQLKSCAIHCKFGASFLNQLCFGSQ